MSTKYAVSLFNRWGSLTHMANNLDNRTARDLADSTRPAGGASYVHDETKPLKFKTYKRPRPREFTLYESTSNRRLTAKQIELAAKRFELDGEHENAANMRALV